MAVSKNSKDCQIEAVEIDNLLNFEVYVMFRQAQHDRHFKILRQPLFLCFIFPQLLFAAFQFKYHTVGLHKVLQALHSFHLCVVNKIKTN